jgi:predicted RND superfamily exporter protein
MWGSLARFILKNRWLLLILLLATTIFMGYHASKVQLSYEFTRAIPTDNPKYTEYQEFRKKFGEDGNLMVVGIQTDKFFEADFFNDYSALVSSIKKVSSVEDVLSVPFSTNLLKDTLGDKLLAVPVFPTPPLTEQQLDSATAVFKSLPFYHGLLYNPSTGS